MNFDTLLSILVRLVRPEGDESFVGYVNRCLRLGLITEAEAEIVLKAKDVFENRRHITCVRRDDLVFACSTIDAR